MVAPLVTGLFSAAMPALERLLDKVIPDPEVKAKAMLELRKEENAALLEELKLALQADQMQADINKVEAGHASIFVAGWRPFIGWVCGTAFAYHYILQPFLAFALTAAGHPVNLPAFDMGDLITVLLGILGLGGMRTFEKSKGVTLGMAPRRSE